MPLFDRIARAFRELRQGEVLIGSTPSDTSDWLSRGYDYSDGNDTPSVLGTAAAQAALGLTWRSFLMAEVTPEQPETEALTPEMLAMTAMTTLAYGNAVTEIQVSRQGLVTYLPAPVFDVFGGLRPENWRYALTRFDQNGDEIPASVPAAGIIHVRYAARPAAPWRGIGPLQAAGITSAQLAQIEQSVLHDAKTPVAHLLGAPDQSTATQRVALAERIRDARGVVSVEATTAGGFGVGAQAAPRKDLEASRVGPEVPATSIQLRDGSALAVEAALGVPAGMFSQNAGATREGLRMFYSFTLLGLARLIQHECREKLNVPDLRISLEGLRITDVSALSRAVSSFVQSGVPLREALRIVGIEDVDVPDDDPNTFQV